MPTYFAQDGNYGEAYGLIVLDTSVWSADDWEFVEAASDSTRVSHAIRVARQNGAEL